MLTIDVRMMYHSGIGTYIRNVVPAVIELLPDLPVGLIGDPRHIAAEMPHDFGRISVIPCTAPIYSITEQRVLPRMIPTATRLYWTPHYPVPLFHGGTMLVTIHDLFHLAVPELAGGMHKQLYARLMFSQAVRKRD